MANEKTDDVFESDEVRELIGVFRKAMSGLRDEVGKVIIGQLLSSTCSSHCSLAATA
jgi:hypothetical protein